MTNRVSKGARVERLALALLRGQGYVVHRCIRTKNRLPGGGFASQPNDIYGVIDIIAKKHGHRTRWIQVTSDSGIGRKKRDLAVVPWEPRHDAVEIWRWVGTRHGRLDRRTDRPLEDLYFQVYRLDEDFRYDRCNRLHVPNGAGTRGDGRG